MTKSDTPLLARMDRILGKTRVLIWMGGINVVLSVATLVALIVLVR